MSETTELGKLAQRDVPVAYGGSVIRVRLDAVTGGVLMEEGEAPNGPMDHFAFLESGEARDLAAALLQVAGVCERVAERPRLY